MPHSLAALDNQRLLEAFAAGPHELSQAVAGFSADQWRQRPIAGQWSTLEVVCHLADFEIVNAERIQRLLAEEQPTLFNADPDDFAAALRYAARRPATALALITATRGHLAEILNDLSPEQWGRTGRHSTDGALSLRQAVERTTAHVRHHLTFIDQKRTALGLR